MAADSGVTTGQTINRVIVRAAGELLDALERDPQVEIVLITEELYQQASARVDVIRLCRIIT